MFRQNWNYDPTLQSTDEALDHFLDVLEAIKKLISEGKIRHFGLSNESAWGVATWIKLSEKYNLPRVVSIQNEYSLLCRLFDTDLAELSHHENVGLLAFSPLAAGLYLVSTRMMLFQKDQECRLYLILGGECPRMLLMQLVVISLLQKSLT